MTSPFPKNDALRAFARLQLYRQQYNEALWDYLTASGYTQKSLPDKIKAAQADNFPFDLVAGPSGDGLLLEDGVSFLLLENGDYLLLG